MSNRRYFLQGCAVSALVAAAPVAASAARAATPARALTLRNLRLRRQLTFILDRDRSLDPKATVRFNQLLRDHHNGAVGNIDPHLITLLVDLHDHLDLKGATIDVISAYRSPETNQMLRQRSARVARNSLHMHGRAIDIRIPGVTMRDLRDAAVDLRRGGVGGYPGFVHLDTGGVRRW